MLIKQRPWIILSLQIGLVCCSAAMAWLIRFELQPVQMNLFAAALPILVLMRVAAIARFNLLHGYWRYTGVNDVADILKAVALGSAGFVIAVRWVLGISAFPISIYLMEAMLSAFALATVRIGCRELLAAMEMHQHDERKQVIVVGAGCAAEMLLRELPRSGFLPVALVDDDSAKWGAMVHGVAVRGAIDSLPTLAATHSVDEILIAIPSACGAQMRRIIAMCQSTGVKFRTIPDLRELIEGGAHIGQLRDVKVEDLLGREPAKFDFEPVRRSLTGRVVMVTGAAGSIGSELCRQILRYGPARLICVDRAETPLFYLQQAIRDSSEQATYRVADITDVSRMRGIMLEEKVQIIFHAAAYKHVPMMEKNLTEALKNNVFALLALLHCAEECGCEDFLLISSDKAVNPTSFMGCTKRLGELIIAARPASAIRCVSVRFGNVLGSQGSVVPLFQEQIRSRRQVTITHPEITRYFMTIPEAVSLVLQSFRAGMHGHPRAGHGRTGAHCRSGADTGSVIRHGGQRSRDCLHRAAAGREAARRAFLSGRRTIADGSPQSAALTHAIDSVVGTDRSVARTVELDRSRRRRSDPAEGAGNYSRVLVAEREYSGGEERKNGFLVATTEFRVANLHRKCQ